MSAPPREGSILLPCVTTTAPARKRVSGMDTRGLSGNGGGVPAYSTNALMAFVADTARANTPIRASVAVWAIVLLIDRDCPATCSVMVSVNWTYESPSAAAVEPSVSSVNVYVLAIVPPASLPKTVTRMRSPSARVVLVGVAVQLFAAAVVPSSTPRSLRTMVEMTAPALLHRSTSTSNPAFAIALDSRPHRLNVTVPEMVTALS
jgi:hypothetical protein